ncbi:MAG: gliding motility protein GldL [Bacteroidales bacterium]|nr:gliding motility protein GldL [Bacteroidales bacterium]
MKKPKVRGIFSGEKGQRIFNILYSIGASIVILGALFKILHTKGADIMLIIGMGTEAVIFFLSAFDEKQMGSGESIAESLERIEKGESLYEEEIEEAGQEATEASTTSSCTIPATPSHPHTFTPPHLTEATSATDQYVRQMTELNETLAKLQQSLAQNIQGLNAMYELQLRDASSQLDAVNKVQRETAHMTENIKQLNAIYERMLAAMQNK